MEIEALQLDMAKVFREKLKGLSRNELLDIIRDQNPDYIKDINRIEFVFKFLLHHLSDAKGNPITDRTFTNDELISLIDPPFIHSKDLEKLGFNEAAQRQIHIASDPVLWAQTILTIKPRAYQALVLRDPNHQKVLRFGRRLGKTVTLSILALWYAYTHQEGKVLVIAPMKSHVELIYKEVMGMVEKSAAKSNLLLDAIPRAVTAPQFEIDFVNRSSIKFFTTGVKSNNKTNVARGQEADIIILDEMDYMGGEDLVAIYAMLQKTNDEKEDKKQLIGASTPSGLRETFWKWNTDPEEQFSAFYFPSYVNPFWDAEEEKRQRKKYPDETKYQQEIEADFGEPAEGVYPRKHVDRAFKTQAPWSYDLSEIFVEERSHYVMGVDWDKVGAGVNIVILEICGPDYEDSRFANRSRVIYREEINKGAFTYTAAVDRIIFLNAYFNLDHIYVDKGAGEVQIELLHKHGLAHPETMLQHKVKGFQFRENIEVHDPYTLQPEKKPVKQFMVTNLYRMLEDDKIVMSEEDDELYFQLISYVVLRRSAYGEPIYGPGGGAVDHAHDALILACLAAQQNYDEFLQVKYARTPRAVSNEAILPLFAVNTEKDKEIAKEVWGDDSTAPVLHKRPLVSQRRTPRGKMIKRPMIR
jgi:hypothetical protein